MKLNLISLIAGLAQCLAWRSSGVHAANELAQDLLIAGGAIERDPGRDGGSNGSVYVANEDAIQGARRAAYDERGLLRPDFVAAANDGNLEGTHLSQALTQYAVGLPDVNGVEALLQALAPAVPTGMRFSYQVHTAAEEFQAPALANLKRPIGGEFPIVRLTGSEANDRLHNLGLTTFIDHDQGGLNPLVQQMAVANLTARISRAELTAVVALIDAAATADSSSNWGAGTSNPDGDMRASLKAGKLARGMRSNLVLIGDAAWNYRQDAYEQAARTNVGSKASYTEQQLAAYLGVGRVIRADDVKRSSDTAVADIVGAAAYSLYVDPSAGTNDPSNVKRFILLGAMGATEVFIEFQTKRVKVTVSKYANTKITSTAGIRKLPVTYS